MHTIYFNLKLTRPVKMDEIMRRIKANRRIALTNKKSSASVFSFGRDHGIFGRILNQTVIASNTLTMKGDRELVGMCFTPQDGNSLLSSIAGTLWFLHADSYEEPLEALRPYFFSEI
jgi:glyceraldehyde-3-phosphate dehydrogenase (NAD(P))